MNTAYNPEVAADKARKRYPKSNGQFEAGVAILGKGKKPKRAESPNKRKSATPSSRKAMREEATAAAE